jgi:hypothetical protein
VFMVLNTTFNNISVIWVAVSFIGGGKHWPVTSHWLALSHSIVSSTPHLSVVRTHNISDDRQWLHRYWKFNYHMIMTTTAPTLFQHFLGWSHMIGLTVPAFYGNNSTFKIVHTFKVSVPIKFLRSDTF